MKNNARSFFGLLHWMLPVLILVAIFSVAAMPTAAHAADKGIQLSTLSTQLPSGILLAQIDAPDTENGDTTTPAPAPFYTDGAFIGGVVAAIMAVFGIWQNKGKRTAEKVSESLVIAIEVATKIPAVAEKEKEIKAAINKKVTQLGVQPLVHRIVRDVTL